MKHRKKSKQKKSNKRLQHKSRISKRHKFRKEWSIIIYLIIAIIIILSGIYIYKNYFTSKVAQEGDLVGVLYVGKLQNGTVFDTNIEEVGKANDIMRTNYSSLRLRLGAGEVIKGFNDGVIGMKVGEKKTIIVSAEDGYGPYIAEKVQTVSTDEFQKSFPSIKEVHKGMKLLFQTPSGDVGVLVISNVGSGFVSLDFNHELAGKTLIFDVELVSIQE